MTDYPSIAAAPPTAAIAQNGTAPGDIPGGIPGGALRPGAIDQSQFQQMLQAQYRLQQQGKAGQATGEPGKGLTLADYRKQAGIETNRQATAAPASTASIPNDGIPTLSLEQFAALTGMSLPPEPAIVPESAATGVPLASGPIDPEAQVEMLPDGEIALEPVAETADAATTPEASPESTDGIPVLPDEAVPEETEATDERVVMLDHFPDRDEQKSLAAAGKRWRMKETEGARELFLGPDGKFGWDDFIDIINPLQHIPVVAQVYRAVTGDQAYGLSNFVGALPFGPLSVASAVADTVIRAQTGRDAGTDMAASILGIDNRTPEEANLHLVTRPADQAAMSADAAAEAVQVAQLPPATSWNRDSTARD
ncbi:hypothetical protein [Dongia sp.]|uniref:hypothetical protein n=1 Tax=Dongia sp. TaxID=1977262 RepID=UPI0035B0D0DB